MGYVRGFVHGTVVGTVVGLCIAPQPGRRTREQLQAFGAAAREGYGVAEKTVRRMAPLASTAAHIARQQAERVRHGDTEEVSVEGSVRIHDHTNGKGGYER